MLELDSRVQSIIFGWDIHKYIYDEKIDEKLDEVLEAFKNNKILNLKGNFEEIVDLDYSDGEICYELSDYLKEFNKNIATIETPVPRNLKVIRDGDYSWSSSFGYTYSTVFIFDNFEEIQSIIKEIEGSIFENELAKLNKKGENYVRN